MRISTAQIYSAAISGMLDQQGKLLETQNQLSTGKRLLSPSDDPVGAVRSLELQRALAKTDQFQTNVNLLDSRLRLEESALSESVQILQQVRERALEANNATQTNETRLAISRELDQQLDALLTIANTRDAEGRSIFAGYQQDVQASTLTNGSVTYNGDDGQRMLQVGTNRQLADTSPGSEVFMGVVNGNGHFQTRAADSNTGDAVIDAGAITDIAAFNGDAVDIVFTSASDYELRDASGVVIGGGAYQSGGSINVNGMMVTVDGTPAAGDQFSLRPSEAEDVFSMVAQLRDTLMQPRTGAAQRAQQTSDINSALVNIDQALDRLIARQSESGTRMQALERQKDVNENIALQVEENLGSITDLDYAEAISRFQQQQLGLQAAQQAFAKVQGLSLFNYL